jgi:L-seryl-tRNA(Ser) seleniumtransferase
MMSDSDLKPPERRLQPGLAAPLRELPSVEEVLQRLDARWPRDLLVAETRRVIERVREQLKRGETADVARIPDAILEELELLERPSLRQVINATGVVLHTNLGRAPLPELNLPQGYSNLEYDVVTGKRGKRDTHIAPLLERLLGRPGIAVNNNAAAVYLALNELAAGYEVIVSRGELIEIGDGFRIPDIMARSGAILREVGTTNRTRAEDYGEAIGDRTRLILLVHPSNFHIKGFTAKPDRREVVAVARERGIPVYEDLGSGCLLDLRSFGVDEPTATQSLNTGVNLISFSGDKLLGGPQAGFLVGDAELVTRLRRNPMFRALRLDKLIYASIETTLRNLLLCRYEQIPVLKMIMMTAEMIRERALRLAGQMSGAEVIEGRSVIGGGSTPDQSLPTWLVALQCSDTVESERALRTGEPAVVVRIENNRLLVDLRTVFEEEEQDLLAALQTRSK